MRTCACVYLYIYVYYYFHTYVEVDFAKFLFFIFNLSSNDGDENTAKITKGTDRVGPNVIKKNKHEIKNVVFTSQRMHCALKKKGKQ